jgi:hypothetical protein
MPWEIGKSGSSSDTTLPMKCFIDLAVARIRHPVLLNRIIGPKRQPSRTADWDRKIPFQPRDGKASDVSGPLVIDQPAL